MVSNEELWKRDEDKRWRERTDERLASLTSGETVQNDRLDAMEEQMRELDRVLRGDPEKDSGGIVEHLHEVQTGLNALRALMAPDALGGGGVLNRLKMLEKKEAREFRASEYHWKFWIAIVGFISAVTVAVVTNVDRIEAFWRHQTRPPIETKRPKVRRRRVVVHREAEEDDSAPEGMPEVR